MNLAERQERFAQIDIYPVITPEFCSGRSPLAVLEATLKAGARVVQLRDKDQPERFAAAFREMTSKHDALLIINDSVDLAIKYGADGAHLGQTDLPVAKARQQAPELLLGVSCHDLAQAQAAQSAGASYINIGPIFPTKTKEQAAGFLGPGIIKEISPHLQIPFTVMGGITKKNIAQVLSAGARRIAMVTAITQAEDITGATRDFIRIITSLSS